MATLAEQMLTVMAAEAGEEGCVLIQRLAEVAGCDIDIAGKRIEILLRNGLATMRSVACYRITNEGAAYLSGVSTVRLTAGPKQPHGADRSSESSLTARVWRALRIKEKATIPEIMELIEASPNQYAQVGRYVKVLVDARYLTRLPRRVKGQGMGNNGYALYLLTRDPGPKAPIWKPKAKQLRDPNTGVVFQLGSAA